MDVNLPVDPPVNNNLQSSIYNRIDAITFERIRVANSQLNSRLEIQEKILNKYKREAEKVHDNQYRKIHKEIKKIRKKKPDYIDEFEYGRTRNDSESKLSKPRSLSETSDCSYCKRYYSHHFNIKDRLEKKEETKKPVETDYFNSRLRYFFMNMVRYSNYDRDIPDTPPSILDHDDSLTGNDRDILQESTNTLQDLDEDVFENPKSPHQSRSESKLSKTESRSISKLSKLSDIPVRGSVVNALKIGLENIGNSTGEARRSTAGIRLEAISPKPSKHVLDLHDTQTKRKRRSRNVSEIDNGMLSVSEDFDYLRTGALKTDLKGYETQDV